ncbi:hybrid sensor histidine kinase/response regulator transcription factor [Mucilaginibacter gotjawali]|uniref:histidine kinase n=2 Tax=Mucilaginibacter gotjawali TaxID=1550579 RepID=A0A839S9Y2_9SPHI|nr:hybrid sensor histidine kinase/response regulator transcription factor [Mucilaginibacter gotjawali]MBB3053780.1 signal transduction histidine kinase/ligand-binding sensor domain-containing protein/DNA-binding response OmpR family regulator [Mucilaginibacter gotjawali]
MRLKFSFLFPFVLFFAYINVFAQSNQYQFSRLNISNGLSHNQVNCIFKDSQGFMWFGTASGLNRYDGYTFKVFKHDDNDKNSINNDFINDIFEGPDSKLWVSTRGGWCYYDPETGQFNADVPAMFRSLKLPVYPAVSKIVANGKGDFWFVCPDSGLYHYNALNKKTIRYRHDVNSRSALCSNSISDITLDVKGNIWLAYKGGMVEMLDVKLDKITYRTDIFYKTNDDKSLDYVITVDRDNDLWLYSFSADQGIYYYSPSAGIFKHIDKESAGAKLKSNVVSTIVQADDGLIWIATDHGGINLIDKKGFKITYLLNRPDDAKSLGENSVGLYKDNIGIMWVRTFKEGVSYYHKSIIRFPLYRHFASDPGSLSFEDVDKFAEEKNGNLWIGTNGGGLIYFDRKTGKFTQYKHDASNENSLSSDIIVGLCIDHEQKLWIGTYFGGLDCFDGKTFTHHKHDDKVATSIADDRVWSILEDSSNRLWIGTFNGGLEIFDRSKKIFYHPFNQTDIRCPYVSSIVEDKRKNIWIGGYFGVDKILKNERRVIHYTRSNNANSLIGNNVSSITQDSRGLMWMATGDGVSILNPETNRFTSLTKKKGLPDNQVLNILEDNKGAMWLSTSNGLCKVTLIPGNKSYSFQLENFDETDGLQGREFNVNAALKTHKGELIFGGAHGFNMFDPLSIHPNINDPKLIFTDFQLFNKSIAANEIFSGHVILSKAISATHEITLNHSENVFTIEFASLNYLNPNKIAYQYMMEGFDKGWRTADNATRKATYTNLDGGTYIFKVRALNADGVGRPAYAAFKINVLPPFWKAPLAYVIYLILLVGILLFIRQRGIQKIRKQFAAEKEKQESRLLIEQERQEVKRMHELDQLKIKFLTNVSHEFRTPLSLIIAPVDKMLTRADQEQKQQLNMIGKNARRLLNLVNQLLDFRKMEVQELKLHSKPGDIVKFIKEISLSFTDIAEEKEIGFIFDTAVDSLFTSFDHDKIERILFNLISNAFKFTQAGGHVSVLLSVAKDSQPGSEGLIEIRVIDTGIGIPFEKQDKIFERFFQNDIPASMINQGSGIGLAITREFVKMHGGEISIESEPDHGSCFIIKLPFVIYDTPGQGLSSHDNADIEKEDLLASDEIKNVPKQQHANKKPTVLLVEDNDDFRFYLKDNLKDIFFIIEASNGKDGWQKALSQHPDIIVSDISMPEMTGIELCKKLKSDKRTSHIPVILLTALTGEADQLKGLEIGANDYMTKPFNFEILLSKIKNLLVLRDTYKRTYKKQMDVQLQEAPLQNEDEKLLRSIVEYIELNIVNENLSVEELSRQMNMSRGSLYNKVLMLTGKSPVEFIRSIRLKKAVYLLENSQMTISQICYEVGFNTPKYFTKLFKDEYNILPSAYTSSIRQKKNLTANKE